MPTKEYKIPKNRVGRPDYTTRWPTLVPLLFSYLKKRKRSQVWMAKRLGITRICLNSYQKRKTIPIRHVAVFKRFLRIPRRELMAAIRKDFEI